MHERNKYIFDFSSQDFNKNGLREMTNSIQNSAARHEESQVSAFAPMSPTLSPFKIDLKQIKDKFTTSKNNSQVLD